MTPGCAWARSQAAPLALGMLHPDEVSRVYDHLMLCPACDEAVQRLVAMTSLVGLAADQIEPPPDARQALLSRVSREGHGRRAASSHMVRLLRRATTLGGGWRPPPPANQWLAPLVILLALIVGSLGFQGTLSSTDQVKHLRRENERLSAAAHLVSLSVGREKFGDDALLYPLLAVAARDSSAGGVLLGDPIEPRASLSLWNLTDRPGDYTVTLESVDGTRSAAGAVTIDQHGVGSLDLNLFQPIPTYRVVHVAAAAQPDVDVFTLRLDQSPTMLQPVGET